MIVAKYLAITNALPRGCGVQRSLLPQHVVSLVSLCDTILAEVKDTIPWGEGMNDQRKRCYGFINEYSQWKNIQQLCAAGIVMDTEILDEIEKETPHFLSKKESESSSSSLSVHQKHDITVNKGCTTISLTVAQKEAIDYVITQAQEVLHANSAHLQLFELECLDIKQLVAIQPNVHHHTAYLPLHLDQPRHDGFGVVIVTGEYKIVSV